MAYRVLKFQMPSQTLLQIYPHSRIISSLPPRIFGCTTFVHIHSYNQNKLDPKATKCLFLGYSSTQKGYKCYSLTTCKLYTSIDVTFFENQPYYPKTHIQGEKYNIKEYDFWTNRDSQFFLNRPQPTPSYPHLPQSTPSNPHLPQSTPSNSLQPESAIPTSLQTKPAIPSHNAKSTLPTNYELRVYSRRKKSQEDIEHCTLFE
ncbi:hypothetical protein TorRG33x02_125610 [Trema orientale]|uniref:Retroviral polymerase SH3-like domain-containing protein n=1 Tax=Trema orientale TaxID=63057 RepID=A0A2P5F1S2_TREOI|nr:hypothetical protein TorRG33x02_125610 [Trema orientale]